MFDDATIVAIATANGIGSISIVRISGVNALEIATKISKKTTFQIFVFQVKLNILVIKVLQLQKINVAAPCKI